MKQLNRIDFGTLTCSVVVAVLLLCLPKSAFACREGVTMLEHILRSDTVAVIEKPGSRTFGVRPVQSRMRFKFVEILKPLVDGDIQSDRWQILLADGLNVPAGYRRYLAFLTYEGGGVWRAPRCAYLEITPRQEVRQVCQALTDLYGTRPYERERLCLLSVSGDVPLSEVKDQLEIHLGRSTQVRGKGVVRSLKQQAFSQSPKVFFSVERSVKLELFGDPPPKKDFPIAAYVSSTLAHTPEQLERSLRPGKSFAFRGKWQRGAFIIDAIE